MQNETDVMSTQESDVFKSPQGECFTFGDPTPVMSRYDFLYNGCYSAGSRWYEPPVDVYALAKIYRATAHHGSAIQVKRNIMLKTFVPTKFLSRSNFEKLVLDYLVFGNCYAEEIESRIGNFIGLKPALAKYVRRGINLDTYWWVHGCDPVHEFAAGSVAHLMVSDINQEIYGTPDYLGALQSILLNEGSTLFRRKYFENGSHAGFILYMTDAAQKQEDVDKLRTALKDAKGPGNFRNLFMYAPNGKKDGIQILPVSEVAAKDDFWNIKNASRDDQLASHRTPPQLMGIIPANSGGFGSTREASIVFAANEVEPMQQHFLEFNDIVRDEVIKFNPYALEQIINNPSK